MTSSATQVGHEVIDIQERFSLLRDLPGKAEFIYRANRHLLLRSTYVGAAGSVTNSRILFVGDAPGEVEENERIPFRGAAGLLLRELIAEAGIKDPAFTNIVKYRPAASRAQLVGPQEENRHPTKEEFAVFMPLLEIEKLVFDVSVVVAVGAQAATALKGSEVKITRDRGEIFIWKSTAVIPILHPSFLIHKNQLHRGPQRQETVADLKTASATVEN